jgi:RimJ/RimL family protein N-acetyltransferase
MGAPELRTARLILRHWRDEDLAAYGAMNADAEVMAHYPRTLSRAESDASARRIRDGLATRSFGLWAVEIPGGVPFIGYVGLAEPGFSAHFTPCHEIGWRLARPHWGMGYASEAAAAVRDFAFEALGLEALVSFTIPANLRSRRVMERIGMRRDEPGDFQHPGLPMGHPMRPHVLYRLRKADWAGRGI